MTTVKINVTLIGRTDLAILVNDGRREAWVATEKGLQPSQQDDCTMDLFGGAG